MKRKGFTLAEVLVTLAIVGVIATIAIPTLLHSVPNKEMIMYKKAFYLVSRNVNEIINDEELYPENPDHNIIGLQNINIANQRADGQEATYHGTSYSGDTKFCSLLCAKMNTRSSGSCSTLCSNSTPFETADGMVWTIPKTNFANDTLSQVDYIVSHYPKVEGMKTYFITGKLDDTHLSKKKVNIGKRIAELRDDMIYLGENSCDLIIDDTELVSKEGKVYPPENGIESGYLSETKTNESYINVREKTRRNFCSTHSCVDDSGGGDAL